MSKNLCLFFDLCFSFPRGSFGDCSFIAEILELKGTNCSLHQNCFHSSLNVGIHRFSVYINTAGKKLFERIAKKVEQLVQLCVKHFLNPDASCWKNNMSFTSFQERFFGNLYKNVKEGQG